MAHNSTVFSQILKLFSRHEFDALAKEHHVGQKLRKATRFDQFLALMMAQLCGRSSLRDIVDNLSVQSKKLYHLGAKTISRSTLARINEKQPYTLYESIFNQLLKRCQPISPKHKFKFKNKLYSLDASTIDLCLSLFSWAKFRSTKGAFKLHVRLDHSGFLPEFVTITDGATSDIKIGRLLEFPKHSIVVIHRGYIDYHWFNQLKYFLQTLRNIRCQSTKKECSF